MSSVPSGIAQIRAGGRCLRLRPRVRRDGGCARSCAPAGSGGERAAAEGGPMSTQVSGTSDIAVIRGAVDLKLEAVVIPVTDVDRAKSFYSRLGWRLDADFAFDNG